MLRIAVFCGGSYVSGTEIAALSTLEGLQIHGHELLCIVNAWNDGDFIQRLGNLKIPYKPIFTGKISFSLRPTYIWWTINALIHLPGAWIQFGRVMKDYDPDVILIHNRDAILMFYFILRNRKTIYHVHDIPPSTQKSKFVYYLLNSKVATFIAVSTFIQRRLIQLGIPNEKVIVIHNGVITNSLIPITKNSSHNNQPVVIGIVGQIGNWKGHDDLIDALDILQEKCDNFSCHIFGSGNKTYVSSLKEKVDAKRLTEKVRWCGFERSVALIYADIDICVVPSRFEEPFGLVAAEAGAAGLPVIASNTGGLPEIVRDGENGFLVEPSNPSQLAYYLEILIRNVDLRHKMGAAGRMYALENFSAERMQKNVNTLCHKVTTNSK